MKPLAFLFLTGMIVNVMADDSSPVNGRLIIHADQSRGTISRILLPSQMSQNPVKINIIKSSERTSVSHRRGKKWQETAKNGI